KQKSPVLYDNLLDYRADTLAFTPQQLSEFLIECSIVLETFLAKFFNIEEAVSISQLRTTTHNPIALFKKYFVLRRAKKELARVQTFSSFNELNSWLITALEQFPLQSEDKELSIALLGAHYLDHPGTYAQEIEKIVQWCAQ